MAARAVDVRPAHEGSPQAVAAQRSTFARALGRIAAEIAASQRGEAPDTPVEGESRDAA